MINIKITLLDTPEGVPPLENSDLTVERLIGLADMPGGKKHATMILGGFTPEQLFNMVMALLDDLLFCDTTGLPAPALAFLRKRVIVGLIQQDLSVENPLEKILAEVFKKEAVSDPCQAD
jgi:hypothetical protein